MLIPMPIPLDPMPRASAKNVALSYDIEDAPNPVFSLKKVLSLLDMLLLEKLIIIGLQIL
jgi:hypothetical protein